MFQFDFKYVFRQNSLLLGESEMKDPWGIFSTRDWTRVSRIAGRSFTVWATREAFALEGSAFILRSPSTDWMRPTFMKLKLQYFGHLMRRTDSLEKTLIPGKIERRRREWQGMRWWWMVSPTWWTWVWASSRSWWWTGRPGMLQLLGSQRVRHDWVIELADPHEGDQSTLLKVPCFICKFHPKIPSQKQPE